MQAQIACVAAYQQPLCIDAGRKVKQAEARALMAEEQLAALNTYMAKATTAYQTEIMRLRKSLSAHKKPNSAAEGLGKDGKADQPPGVAEQAGARARDAAGRLEAPGQGHSIGRRQSVGAKLAA